MKIGAGSEYCAVFYGVCERNEVIANEIGLIFRQPNLMSETTTTKYGNTFTSAEALLIEGT